MAATATNPHWVEGLPAWDVTLENGDVHKDVTKREIQIALNGLHERGEIGNYDRYIDVVRENHIQSYGRFHTASATHNAPQGGRGRG